MNILETLSQPMTKEDRLCYIRKLIEDAHPILDWGAMSDDVFLEWYRKNKHCRIYTCPTSKYGNCPEC